MYVITLKHRVESFERLKQLDTITTVNIDSQGACRIHRHLSFSTSYLWGWTSNRTFQILIITVGNQNIFNLILTKERKFETRNAREAGNVTVVAAIGECSRIRVSQTEIAKTKKKSDTDVNARRRSWEMHRFDLRIARRSSLWLWYHMEKQELERDERRERKSCVFYSCNLITKTRPDVAL